LERRKRGNPSFGEKKETGRRIKAVRGGPSPLRNATPWGEKGDKKIDSSPGQRKKILRGREGNQRKGNDAGARAGAGEGKEI